MFCNVKSCPFILAKFGEWAGADGGKSTRLSGLSGLGDGRVDNLSLSGLRLRGSILISEVG